MEPVLAACEAGDVLAVTLLDIEPGPFGYTSLSGIGFISDQFDETLRLLWRLDRTEAVSDDLPGVRIPNHSFPGVVTVPSPTSSRVSRSTCGLASWSTHRTWA